MLNIGDPAPDFTLPNQDEQMIRLSDYRGKTVILFAYPKANTYGCTAQACAFRDALPRFEDMNAVILGISADTPAENRSFKQRQKLPYDLLSDEDHAVLTQYAAWGMSIMGILTLPVIQRSYWVIDAAGRLLAQKINVGPAESVELALRALTAPLQR